MIKIIFSSIILRHHIDEFKFSLQNKLYDLFLLNDMDIITERQYILAYLDIFLSKGFNFCNKKVSIDLPKSSMSAD